MAIISVGKLGQCHPVTGLHLVFQNPVQSVCCASLELFSRGAEKTCDYIFGKLGYCRNQGFILPSTIQYIQSALQMQFGNMQLCINAQYIQSRAAHQEYDINLKLQLMYL